jgi:uncharacterized membrane protein (UPF0127 family)
MKTVFAGSFARRVRGLLGYTDFGATLMLCPCNDVHTFGMAFPIDVAFVSREGVVMRVLRGVKPGRRSRLKGATFVLERRAADDPWVVAGERIGFCVLANEGERSRCDEDVPHMRVCDVR